MWQRCVVLTEVAGDHQETLERLLGFTDEVNEILYYSHQQSSTGSDLVIVGAERG